MGTVNLLKASWDGKVGQIVGAKWKNKSTIRTYSKPAYTNTPAQQTIREGFGEITSFVALFADQIKSLSALDTKGMSVRNAIIKLNKEQVTTGALDTATLLVSRGGLPKVSTYTAQVSSGHDSITASWTPLQGATISAKAKIVVIAVNQAENFAVVGTALNSAGSISIPSVVPPGVNLETYCYILDFRGSSKVASPSVHSRIISP